MNHKLLITLAALALIMASCAKNEIIEPQPRVMHITATVEEPTAVKESAAARATLEELETGAIRFKWQVNDIIQMAFVQGSMKKTANATVTTVSDDGRTAQFTVDVPTEITGDFTLYAYRSSLLNGGGELLADNPVIAVLPKTPWDYVGLLSRQHPFVSLWDKKTVAYSGGDMPAVSLAFKHLGAMMTMKINNTTGAEIGDISSLGFASTSGIHWLRNHTGYGMAQFNMETGSYVAGQESTGYGLYVNTSPGYGNIKTGVNSYSQWFVPGAYTADNSIKVEALNTSFATIGTTNSTKPALDFKPGNNYVVYLKIGGTTGNYTLQYSNAAWD